MEEMTVPLDTVNDIRSMDAAGRSRSEIARVLHVSRNTVAKYADMEDMSPAAPMPRRRGRPALEGNEEWVAGVLEADLGAPRKQRHTARRIYDRLVAERGYGGSYSTVQRFVRELRLARAAAGGEGYLELEWAPGTCQVDFGNFRAAVGGRTLDLKLLVATLPHSNDRQCVALMSQRSECLCAGLLEIFRRWGLDLLHYIRQFHEGLRNDSRKVPRCEIPSTPGSSQRSSGARSSSSILPASPAARSRPSMTSAARRWHAG